MTRIREARKNGMERKDLEMNDNLDHIRRIQTQLTEIPCRTCHRQGLALLLRYDGYRGQCLFMAFCRVCQTKDPVDPDTAPRMDAQELDDLNAVPENLAKA